MNSKIEIRTSRIVPGEADEISQLIKEVVSPLDYYSEFARRAEISKYTPELLQESIRNDPDSILVGRNGSNILGFCLSRYDDGLIWLAWFGVHPRWRRQGIASALLSALEPTVHPRGCHKIWCDCRTVNKPSKAVLELSGYKMICTVVNHWYGHDFILWEKLVP